MYSDTDLESAVTAGALSPAAAAAFRAHVAAVRATPLVDEEHFRLITGFNDIFVAIASILLLAAVGWLGALAGAAIDLEALFAGVAVAVVAWALAEYFTRARRMALPSILLLLAFVGGMFAAVTGVLVTEGPHFGPSTDPVYVGVAAAVAGGAAWLHWRRFKVPITVAAGAAAVVATLLAAATAAFPAIRENIRPLMFVAGLGVFAFAMRWDMSDPTRQTRRSDVAFWLHLLAAPLIVHPAFTALAATGDEPSAGIALVVVLLYVGLALVALAIDRRALMVSALAYVLFAISALFREVGTVGLNVALTALVIGSALLLLSAFWHVARAAVVRLLPERTRRQLPPAAGSLSRQPAA